ncbi:MAG: ATP-binding protein [bacterium]|nr:ATP-binding protein [bacterium]
MAPNPVSDPSFVHELLTLVCRAFEGAHGLVYGAIYLREGEDIRCLAEETREEAEDLSLNLSASAYQETLDNGLLVRELQIPGHEGLALAAVAINNEVVLALWAQAASEVQSTVSVLGLLASGLFEDWAPANAVQLAISDGSPTASAGADLTDTSELEEAIEGIGHSTPTAAAELAEPQYRENQVLAQHGKAFLEHPDAAFLAFTNKGTVVPLYTNGFHPYFGQLDAETDALEILLHHWTPYNRDSASFAKSEPDIAMLRDLMETVFLRITDLDVLQEMLPNELRQGDSVLKISYRYLQDAQDMDQDMILVMITDISAQVALERRIQEEANRNEMILKIAMDLEGYDQYRKTSEEILRGIIVELEKPADEIRADSILGSINTLQSGAEIFEITEMSQLTEDFEHALLEILENPEGFGADAIAQLMMMASEVKDGFDRLQIDYLDSLIADNELMDRTIFKVPEARFAEVRAMMEEEVFKGALNQLDQIFDKNYRPFTKLPGLQEITSHRLSSIKNHLWNEIAPKGLERINQGFDSMMRQPIGLVLKKYGIIAENFAKRLNKQLVIEVTGHDLDVPLHRMQDLFSALIHLVRNSVQHGLEKMEERVFLGKDLEGHMKIAAALEGDQLVLTFEDDGRGLNAQKIRQEAVERGQISAEEAESLNDEQSLALLFSTDEDQSNARGVGLESVYLRVKELGGDLKVTSELEKGTCFTITLPINL